MALFPRKSQLTSTDLGTGFGTNPAMTGGRLLHKDGKFNVEKRGLNWLRRHSIYHTFLQMPRWKFFATLLLTYVSINLLFASLYYLIGTEHLAGIIGSTPMEKFMECFFFSTQTFTTLGYGRISPTGTAASGLATFEAFLGLLNFAIATGLFYGRFSRPLAFLRFSKHAIIAPYRDGIAIMFRLVPFKNTYLSNAQVRLTLSRKEEINGQIVNRFYPLPMELDRVNALTLSWTVVHPIDEKSPLSGTSFQDWMESASELLVYVEAFDDTFSNTVMARSSYSGAELKVGMKFLPMYHRSTDGNRTILNLDKLDDMQEAEIAPLFPLA